MTRAYRPLRSFLVSRSSTWATVSVLSRRWHSVSSASNPFSTFNNDDVTLIKNPGKADMEILVKEGETLAHYKSSGEIGQGEGAKAGIAYRLKDGSMIYVPE